VKALKARDFASLADIIRVLAYERGSYASGFASTENTPS
jgi:hypothetical protein